MYDSLLEKIHNISDYSELCDKDLLQNVYNLKDECDKSLLLGIMIDKAKKFGKKVLFDKLLAVFDKKDVVNKNNNICLSSDMNIDDDYEYDLDVNTGEFVVTLDGIYDKFGMLVSSTPVLPYRLYRKNVDNVEKVRVLYYKNDKWDLLDVDRGVIASQNKIIDLANHGIGVNSANSLTMVRYFSTIFDKNTDIIPVRDSVGKLGWVDDNTHFIPYKSTNYDFVLSVNGNALSGSKQIYDAIVEKGDYDIWFDCMMKMRTNVPTRLAFGASAVSPLLTILGSPCFVTMLYGQTGTGKTLSCRCAVSMWGNPDVLSTRADSTPTSIIRKCLFFNNLPLFVDEFQLLRSDDSQDFLMSVTEGMQRTRSTMDSSNNFTSSSSWKNCTLITGEKQCVQHNTGGGAVNRIIELRIDDMVADEMDLQDIYYKIENNYGFLGKKLIDLYMDESFQKKVKKRFKEIQDSWREQLNTASKQLIAISCLVLGDEILREYFFHDDEEITVDMIEQYVASKDDISQPERVYHDVCDLLIANRGRFINDVVPINNTGAPSNMEIWGYICKNEPNKYYIIPKILKSELRKRDNTILDNTILEDWKNKGYINCTYEKGKFSRYDKKVSVSGLKPWVYVFNMPKDKEEIEEKEDDDLS